MFNAKQITYFKNNEKHLKKLFYECGYNIQIDDEDISFINLESNTKIIPDCDRNFLINNALILYGRTYHYGDESKNDNYMHAVWFYIDTDTCGEKYSSVFRLYFLEQKEVDIVHNINRKQLLQQNLFHIDQSLPISERKILPVFHIKQSISKDDKEIITEMHSDKYKARLKLKQLPDGKNYAYAKNNMPIDLAKLDIVEENYPEIIQKLEEDINIFNNKFPNILDFAIRNNIVFDEVINKYSSLAKDNKQNGQYIKL